MSNYPSYGAPGTFAAQLPAGAGQPANMNLQKILARIGEQALWSTHAFEADGTTTWGGDYDVFATALGSAGQGFARSLGPAETNLQEASRIPNGLSFKVYGVAAHPYGLMQGDRTGSGAGKAYSLSVADYNAIQAYGIARWFFLTTTIDIAPLQAIGSAGGTFGGGTADTGAAYGGAGTTSMGSQVALNHGGGSFWTYQVYPVQLQAGVTLRVRLSFNTSAPVIDGGPLVGQNQTPAYDPAIRLMLFGVYENAIAVG